VPSATPTRATGRRKTPSTKTVINVTQTAAIGQALEFGFGGRDNGTLTGGPVLIDNFHVEGLLEFDEGSVQLIPEAGTFSLLGLSGASMVFFRRRKR
jgi:hypothetical protein